MLTPRIYADHAASTPVRDEVLAAMLPYFSTIGFNASSLHAEGRAARAALDDARRRVAAVIGATSREIVFTGSGSEAIALAIVGASRAAGAGRHVVTCATEHDAVLRTVDGLAGEGYAVTVLAVDSAGRVDPAAFEDALRPETVLVSLMLANNEIGTLHPVAEIARVARRRGILVHTDAVQAAGRIPLDVEALGVDLLSLSAHKFSGPKGVGVLYVRSGTPLSPLVVGGPQEGGLRAGTENVAGAVGVACALDLARAEMPAETPRLARLRDRFEATIVERIPDVRINASTAERLPTIASVAFAGVDRATLLVRLDLAGVSLSAGSACAAGASEPSHVVAAIHPPAWVEASSVRFSFGKLTTEEDVERLITMLPEVVRALRVGDFDLGTSASGAPLSRPEVRF
jgi:cysteine desulfurase